MHRIALVALLAAAPALAHADDEDEHEKPTAVTATLVGTTVRMKARFAFDVEGPAVGLNSHAFPIPASAMVTSGSVIVDGKRHALELKKADDASRAFDGMTLKPGTVKNRAWAFVIDGGSSLVTLDVLAPKTASVVLELTLEAPTCFFNDRRFIELPNSWWQRVANHGPIGDEAAIGAACAGGIPDEDHVHWLGFASAHLMKQPAGAQRIGALAGRLPLDTKHFARVELDVARELSAIPNDLHTVIVFDHSRSLSADELESERAIALAYIRGAPRSRVQVIGYARHSEALLPSWMVASQAASRVEAALLELPPRNGSNVDEALREAATWLARVQGTKRILLFSDERLSEWLTNGIEPLRELVADDTLVNVVRPAAGIELERRDSLLSPLAIATQGIEVFGSSDPDKRLDVTMLLRPTSIDHVEVTATGWETSTTFADPHDCRDTLLEGNTCTWWGEGDGAAGPITITGLMWNKPFKRVVRPDPTQSRQLARALSLIHALDEELQKQVDLVALAVNSAWSLFATWGGGGGYEDVGGYGRFGTGSFGTSSHDVGIGTPGSFLGRASLDLQDQLAPAIAACKPGAVRGVVQVETTLDEIVAVSITLMMPLDSTVYQCIIEAVWDTTLRIPNAPPHATSRVAFGNKR